MGIVSSAFRMTNENCVFCKIIQGQESAEILYLWSDAIAIVPINPCAPGHILIIPKVHVATALENPDVSALVMRRAAQIATDPCNLIVNVGKDSSQTVFHLHLHIVPRTKGDGLLLPWSTNKF